MPRREWRIAGPTEDILLLRAPDASAAERSAALRRDVAGHAASRWFPNSDPLTRARLLAIYREIHLGPFDASSMSTALLRDRVASALASGTLIAVSRPHGALGLVGGPMPEEAAPKPGEAAERKKITAVHVKSLTFTSEHHLLTDYTTDWKRGGEKYVDKDNGKHWTPAHNFPISHSMNKIVSVAGEFEVEPPDAPGASIEFIGDGSIPPLKFRGTGSWSGKQPVDMTANGSEVLPKKVQKLTQSIDWQAQAAGETFGAGATGAHVVYVTLDTPIDEGKQEDGVTLKRMDKAVELVGATASVKPHEIVAKLMKLLPYYTLQPSPNVPAHYHHPNYFNDEGGAWGIADYITDYAECQAIVRFVRGVIKQVGCPGQAETIVIWADPDVQGGAKALEHDWETGGGLNGKTKVVGHNVWYAALLDRDPVAVGHVFSNDEMGFNNFEACLKFTADGVTKNYGGGAGVYDSAQQVIRAFFALAWISPVYDSSGNVKYRIEKIVRRYR